MASMTVHDISIDLAAELSRRAVREGVSKNRLIKDTLARSFGLEQEGVYADDYREFCGLWTAEEAASYRVAQKDNDSVDPGDWQ